MTHLEPITEPLVEPAVIVAAATDAAEQSLALQKDYAERLADAFADSALVVSESSSLADLEAITSTAGLREVEEFHARAIGSLQFSETLCRDTIKASHAAHKGALGILKALSAGPEWVKSTCSLLIGAYRRKLEAEAREAARKLEAEARERQLKEQREAAQELFDREKSAEAVAVLETPPAPVARVAAPVRTVAKTKGLSTVDHWTFEIATPSRPIPLTWDGVVELLGIAEPYERGVAAALLLQLFGIQPSYLTPDTKSIGQMVRAIKSVEGSAATIGPACVAIDTPKARPTGRGS